MDHNMVLSYDYANQKSRWGRTNAPPSQVISMAMRRLWSGTCGIAQCSMTRASPEATGRRHRATTGSVSPRRPTGQQQTKQRCKMCPLCWPFWWPSRCAGTILCASPDEGGLWLSLKPLNAAIGRALALIGINCTCLPLFQGYISSSNR